MKDAPQNTAIEAKQKRSTQSFPPLRSVGDDATSYHGNQKHFVIAIPARSLYELSGA